MSNFEAELETPSKKVVVGNAPQPMDASLLQMELEAHGIDSVQDGEYTVAIDPLLSNAIGGIRVLVAEADEAAAREVLAEFYRKRREDETALERTCPACGAENAQRVKRSPVFWILIVITLGIFSLLVPWRRFECPECGHRWR